MTEQPKETEEIEKKESRKREVTAAIAGFVVMAALGAVFDILRDKSGNWVKHQIAPDKKEQAG